MFRLAQRFLFNVFFGVHQIDVSVSIQVGKPQIIVFVWADFGDEVQRPVLMPILDARLFFDATTQHVFSES